MKLKKAIKVLELHSRWREGEDIEMQRPSQITKAIGIAVKVMKEVIKEDERDLERNGENLSI